MLATEANELTVARRLSDQREAVAAAEQYYERRLQAVESDERAMERMSRIVEAATVAMGEHGAYGDGEQTPTFNQTRLPMSAIRNSALAELNAEILPDRIPTVATAMETVALLPEMTISQLKNNSTTLITSIIARIRSLGDQELAQITEQIRTSIIANSVDRLGKLTCRQALTIALTLYVLSPSFMPTLKHLANGSPLKHGRQLKDEICSRLRRLYDRCTHKARDTSQNGSVRASNETHTNDFNRIMERLRVNDFVNAARNHAQPTPKARNNCDHCDSWFCHSKASGGKLRDCVVFNTSQSLPKHAGGAKFIVLARAHIKNNPTCKTLKGVKFVARRYDNVNKEELEPNPQPAPEPNSLISEVDCDAYKKPLVM